MLIPRLASRWGRKKHSENNCSPCGALRINSADMEPEEEVGLVYEGNDFIQLGSDYDLMLTR